MYDDDKIDEEDSYEEDDCDDEFANSSDQNF
jgi:hypothetical protein